MNSRILVLLTASSLVLAPVGMVLAQSQSGGETGTAQAQQDTSGTSPLEALGRGHDFGRGFGHGLGRGLSGLPFGHLALGTTVELTFYDGDPAADGQRLQTLNFTYGEDSEAAFAEQFAAARAEASYVTAAVGEQSRTLELSTADTNADTDNDDDDGFRRGFGRGGLSLGDLNDGSTVTAVFYDGDPEANGQSLQTLTFTYGESSEAGFAADFAAAAENAAFVVVTTSPQTYTVPLTASSFGEDFGGRGDRDGRGGFGRGNDGRGGSR